MTRLTPAALAALLLTACTSGEELADPLPPIDRISFYFPTGLAVSRVTVGGVTNTALLVDSSNFDLRYSPPDGGTLLSVLDNWPDKASTGFVNTFTWKSGARIGSYGGPVVVAKKSTCSDPDMTGDFVLVASRFDDALYRFGLGSDGALTGPQVIPLAGPGRDPFSIAFACPSGRALAYVGFLAGPTSTRGAGEGAWIAEVDLVTGGQRALEVGDGPVRSVAWEAGANRLWIASQSSGERALLYSAVVTDPVWQGASYLEAVHHVDVAQDLLVRGAELRTVAVGTALTSLSTRLYVTTRLYDVEAQTVAGGVRPTGDVGGRLLVLDVATPTPPGTAPAVALANNLDLGAGVQDVAIVARGGTERDVVVATALDGDLLAVYDDEIGADTFALELGRDAGGLPVLGDRPMALAVDQPTVGGKATIYVGAFGGHGVTRFDLDPADPTALSSSIVPIGGFFP